MTPTEAATEFLYSRTLAPKTFTWYDTMLKVFCSYCEAQRVVRVEDVTALTLRGFFDVVRERVNPNTNQPVGSHTVHAYARTLRAFLNWSVQEDLLPAGITRKLVMPKRETHLTGTFSNQQFDRLLREAEKTDTPMRDKAILCTLVDTGIRADELCTLTLDNLHFDNPDAWIKVHGKGDKWREVGLGMKSRNALYRYIHRERKSELPLVVVGHKGKLTVSGLDQLIYRLRDAAGEQHFAGVRVSAHTFRHTFACRYMEQGGDVYKLSRLLGHYSVSVTEMYLKSLNQTAARKGKSVLDNL